MAPLLIDLAARLTRPPRVSANLAVAQLADPCLVDDLVALTQPHDLEPSRIVLEVSERVLTGDVPARCAST